MGKLTLVFAIAVSVIGVAASLYLYRELRSLKYRYGVLEKSLNESLSTVNSLTDQLDSKVEHRAIFLHHSVGRGLLTQGGLSDSLLQLGILVRGATYGDSIGEETDMCDWAPKFETEMNRILAFKAHPNQYYANGTTNDLVMFKSCYPNSNIATPDANSKVPAGRQKTMDNYMSYFKSLATVFRKYPDKLFVFMTSPPLSPERTTPENAARARSFNQWLQTEFLPSYQQESGLKNFVVFDLFDQLADEGNVLKEAYRTGPGDSHPNKVGYEAASRRFMEFLRPVWAEFQTSRLAGQPQAVR